MALAELIQEAQSFFIARDIGTGHAALLGALVVAVLTYFFMKHGAAVPGFEVYGGDAHSLSYIKAKNNFMRQGRQMVLDGLKKFKGKPFQVLTHNGPTVIFSSNDAKEIGNERTLTMDGFVRREFFVNYPGFEGPAATVGNRILQDAIRMKLTQSLGLVTNDLCEETEFSLSHIFKDSFEWSSCRIQQVLPDLVARLSTRVFLGPVVARNEEWLKIAVEYTINLMQSSRELRRYPPLLRPFVYRFLKHCRALAVQSRDGRRVISSEIARRQKIWDENDRAGKPREKLSDSLGWMQQIAAERGAKDFDLAGAQLSLTFAAIHTTSSLLGRAMVMAATNPEYQDSLRAEMVQVLAEDGWKKTSLYKMKFLDSFLKEIQRLQTGSITMMSRSGDHDVKIGDTLVPKGTAIKVAVENHYNPDVYPEPEKFDPYRYLKLRNQPGQENGWQFVTTSTESLGFGIGKHACPGRFFASNEVKIAMCWMLIKYEWRQDEVLQDIQIGAETIAHPATVIDYRRREPEIDLSKLEV